MRAGLPQSHAFDLVTGLEVDDSGERVAIGPTTGTPQITDSGGKRWQLINVHLRPIRQRPRVLSRKGLSLLYFLDLAGCSG